MKREPNFDSNSISLTDGISFQETSSFRSSVSDQLDIMTEQFLKGCRKRPIEVAVLDTDYKSLRLLAIENAWKIVVQMSGELLDEKNLLFHERQFQLTKIRLEGLFCMKMYDELIQEVTQILTIEYSKQNQSNYHLIISMRILMAEIKVMSGRSQEAIEQLINVKKWLQSLRKTKLSEGIVEYWKWIVMCSSVNIYLRMRQWKHAIYELKQMIIIIDNKLSKLNPDKQSERILLYRLKIVLLSRISRVLLQIGATRYSLKCAEKAVEVVSLIEACYENDPSLSANDSEVAKANQITQIHVSLCQGLLLFCNDNYEQASELFLSIIRQLSVAPNTVKETSPEDFFNNTRPSMKRPLSDDEFFNQSSGYIIFSLLHSMDEQTLVSNQLPSNLPQQDTNSSFLSVAVNNYTVCCLYLKKISQAISSLEAHIQADPAHNLSDPVVFNLCTLYELSYAPDVSMNKKKILQRIAVRYHVEDPYLHWRSFRLT